MRAGTQRPDNRYKSTPKRAETLIFHRVIRRMNHSSPSSSRRGPGAKRVAVSSADEQPGVDLAKRGRPIEAVKWIVHQILAEGPQTKSEFLETPNAPAPSTLREWVIGTRNAPGTLVAARILRET